MAHRHTHTHINHTIQKGKKKKNPPTHKLQSNTCLLYTSDAADE